MIMMPVLILILPLSMLSYGKERRYLPPYISSQPALPVTADSPRYDINGTG